jgi:hypothetical protein
MAISSSTRERLHQRCARAREGKLLARWRPDLTAALYHGCEDEGTEQCSRKKMEEGGVGSKSRAGRGRRPWEGVVIPCTVDELRLGELVTNQAGETMERGTPACCRKRRAPPSMEEAGARASCPCRTWEGGR